MRCDTMTHFEKKIDTEKKIEKKKKRNEKVKRSDEYFFLKISIENKKEKKKGNFVQMLKL